MTWKTYLTVTEAKMLDDAREARDAERDAYNGVYRLLKNRAESRLRQAKRDEDKQ